MIHPDEERHAKQAYENTQAEEAYQEMIANRAREEGRPYHQHDTVTRAHLYFHCGIDDEGMEDTDHIVLMMCDSHIRVHVFNRDPFRLVYEPVPGKITIVEDEAME